MKTKKEFDCVKMKDDAQQRRAETLRGLSPQQRLEFYRQAHEALAARQKRLRDAGGADAASKDESCEGATLAP